MITKELALTLHIGQELWHSTLKNADGTPSRVRISGKIRVWKTRPDAFLFPVKHGMYAYGYIGRNGYIGRDDEDVNNYTAWSLPERWEIERHASE